MSKAEIIAYSVGLVLCVAFCAFEIFPLIILGVGLNFLMRKGGAMK